MCFDQGKQSLILLSSAVKVDTLPLGHRGSCFKIITKMKDTKNIVFSVPSTLQNGKYGDLFVYALRNFGILCIGLYRFRDTSESAKSPSSKRYVITNPPEDFKLLPTDHVMGPLFSHMFVAVVVICYLTVHMADMCNKRWLLAIPASYRSRHPPQSMLKATMCIFVWCLFFSQPYFSSALYHLAAKFFLFLFFFLFFLFSLMIEFCCPSVCSCLCFLIRGKLMCSDWTMKWESKRFCHLLTCLHPALLPPLFQWPT